LAPLATPNTIYIETHRSVRDYAFLGLNSPHTPAVYPIGIHRAVYSVRCFYGLFLCAEGVHLFISMQNDPIHPFSLHLTPPRLRTGESMHLVRFWPSLTSMARREHQRRASGTRWWVGTAPFSLHLFDTTPSPHRRINAPSLLLAFAHIHGEAGTPTLGICSAVQWWVGTVRCFYVV
jgi:hypothetical protein